MRRFRPYCSALALTSLLLWGFVGTASAEAYLRVISHDAPVHSGPDGKYRTIYSAERGDIYEVLERGTRGYWFRIRLEDGTTGWIFGELVFPFEVGPPQEAGLMTRIGRSIRSAILGPSPVPEASMEVSLSAGVIDEEGAFIVRPAWLIDPHFALEAFAGLSPREQEDLFTYGLGWTLRLAPGAALGPFVHLGLGGAQLRPKADNFVQEVQHLFALSAGGGFEVTLKKQITVRLDYRNWTIFDPDQASNGQEFSSGLAIFF